MVKEIQLGGRGWARGRNGYFIPRRVDCFKDVEGQINLSVSSARPGKVEPISIRLFKAEALELVDVIRSFAGKREETPRVVVVIEGGNVQAILADRPMNVVQGRLRCGRDAQGRTQAGFAGRRRGKEVLRLGLGPPLGGSNARPQGHGPVFP